MEFAIRKSAEEARIRLQKEEVAARARSAVVVDVEERKTLQRSLDDRQAEIAMEYAKRLSASEAVFEQAVAVERAAETEHKRQAEAELKRQRPCPPIQAAERPLPAERKPTPFEQNLLELEAMVLRC
jgi:hypothetical protein